MTDAALFSSDLRMSLFARRPAMPVAILLIAGIVLFDEVAVLPELWLTAAFAFLITALLLRRNPIPSSLLIAVATFFIGLTLAQSVYFRHATSDICNFAAEQPTLVQVNVSIDHAPTLVYPQSPAGRPLPPKQIIVASVLSIRSHDGWIPSAGLMAITLSHPNPWLHLGQQAQAIGLLSYLPPAANPGQLDWATVYRRRGILAALQVSHASNIRVIHDDGVGVFGWLQQESRRLLASGFTVRRMADYSLLRALVLGDTNPDTREVHDAFAQVGIAYQLAISGMHIVVLVSLVYLMCRAFRLSPRWAIAIGILFVSVYGVIALPTDSSCRAVFICVTFLAAPLWSRTGDKVQLLSVAAVGLLVLEPLDVLSAGFQLGFVTVLGLALFAPRWLQQSDDIRAKTRRETGWALARRRVRIALRTWVVLSVIAWIVSLPLVTFHFGEISPWAVVAGIVMFPLVLISLVGGWVKMLATLIWPSVATFAARGVQTPVFAMRLLAVRLTHLPGASITVTPPAIWMIAIYYLLLLGLLIQFRRRWQSRIFQVIAVTGGILFLLAVGSPASAVNPGNSDEATVTLLDVGAGQCAVVTIPNEDGVTLVDCGSDSISDVARSVLVPYLQSIHRRRIARVFLSHSDYDHISALSSITPMLDGPVYTSSYFANFAQRDPPAELLLAKLKSIGRSPTLLKQGDHLSLGSGSIDVLWPPDGVPFNVNDTGLVLKLTFAGRSVLFPADIQANAMRRLLAEQSPLHADVLVAAHHGSSETTTGAFVHAVAATDIVASNGRPLTGKQRIFDQLIGPSVPLFRTSVFGAIAIHLKADSTVSVTTFKTAAKSR